MKTLFYLFFTLCVLTGCSGNAKSEQEKLKADSLRTVDSLAKAEAAKEAAEKARKDSITESALKNDTLKEKHIVVDKPSFTLYLRENGETLMESKVCIGKGVGQKKGKGDHKTPEGTYKIRSIENAAGWTYDFHDGKGKRKGAYGPWFFRLDTPQSTHIGIHGSPFPETVGTRDSDGCIRMVNEDLEELKQHVFVGMKVVINPDLVPGK